MLGKYLFKASGSASLPFGHKGAGQPRGQGSAGAQLGVSALAQTLGS